MDIYYLVNLAHTVSAKFGVSTSSIVLDFLVLGAQPRRWAVFSFTMTVPVAGSTHSVLLPMNVILVKECEESNSPTP